MIISNIIGGLGNQMFQYAAGRALSLHHNVPLLLDTNEFENYHLHQGFELHRVFTCPIIYANPNEIRNVLGWQSSKFTRRLLLRRRLKNFIKPELVVEPHFHYWQDFKRLGDQCYLSGYWQSYRYFEGIANFIRKDFTFLHEMSQCNHALAQEIKSVNSVSLHIRRGDYANTPKTKSWHGVCPLDYYYSAIEYVSKNTREPHFYVFSDDIEWVRRNLRIPPPCTFVGHNIASESYNDIRLMSTCRHNIIANSTFSWWGAWLNPSVDKIVIAPQSWFDLSDSNTDDLYCPDWVLF